MNTKNTVRLRWIAAAVYTVPPKPNFYSLKAQFPHGCCDYAQHDKCKPRTLHTLPPRLPPAVPGKNQPIFGSLVAFPAQRRERIPQHMADLAVKIGRAHV